MIRAIARGRTNQEIAVSLFITVSTVKSHLATIQNKLGVATASRSPPGPGRAASWTPPGEAPEAMPWSQRAVSDVASVSRFQLGWVGWSRTRRPPPPPDDVIASRRAVPEKNLRGPGQPFRGR
ncbi:response regulator transcription factor [Kitasatospora atroaurantiaca]|uniref:response regulator transcription factor n=1 Tax=Kitasatospora atroaurantiaca TaxID=285545 RepID=UPI001FE867EC|nr:LuxR C-terminal-related transcriptional regulator [Kitasatospora atroaurantiaca]